MQDTNIFWTHLQQISQEDKLRLVDKLLACSTIKDKGSRDTVLNLLDSRISNSVSKHSVDQIEVTNIVIASLSHPGGLRELSPQRRPGNRRDGCYGPILPEPARRSRGRRAHMFTSAGACSCEACAKYTHVLHGAGEHHGYCD